MLYVYVLKSQDYNKIYIGITKYLLKRLKEHNQGKSCFTKQYKPWNIVYFEAYTNEHYAKLRERRLKYHGNAIRELKKRIGL